MRFKTKLSLGYGVILILMVSIAIVVYFSIVAMKETAGWVEHTYKVINNGKQLEKLLVDMETGERGFLIAGNEDYLDPFNKGKVGFEKLISETKQQVSDNFNQVARLEQIQELEIAWLENVAGPEISMRRKMNKNTTTINDVTDFIDKGTGKEYMDVIRIELEKLINTEMTLLKQRKRKAIGLNAENVKWVIHTYDVIGLVKDIRKFILDMETGERGFLITGKDEYLESYYKGHEALDTHIAEAQQLVNDNPDQVIQVEKISKMVDIWIKNATQPAIQLRRDMNKNTNTIKDISALIETGIGKVSMDGLRNKLEEFINIERVLVAQRTEIAKNTATFAISATILGTLLALLLGVLIAAIITRSLFAQIGGEPSEIENIAGELALGYLKITSRQHKRTTGILHSLQMMVSSLNIIVNQVNQIAKGDYSTEIEVRSEEDVLGNAILNMTRKLKEVTGRNQQQDWIKTGQSKLNDQMVGEQKEDELTQKIINFLADYLNAQVGVFYLLNSDRLVLASSFAYQIRNNNNSELKIGEGLMGQAARERKPILFTSIPSEQIQLTIQSGLGESEVSSVLAIPLIYNETLFGVIGLGTAGDFDELQLKFLDQCAENIAISLNSAQSRTQMKTLLNATQQQARELQTQQEALKVANKELETQKKALEKSELNLIAQQEELRVTNEELETQTSSLETQQEELRVTNEELETQTKALEEQQVTVQKKNQELEDARQKVEEKAKALEMTSKFKSEFLANMSHELRTPLNSLLILAEILKENQQQNLSDKEVSFAETIHKSGEELLKLINEVLDLAKVEAGKSEVHLEDVPLDELSIYVKNNFQYQVKEKGLILNIKKDDSAPETIHTDFQKVLQIIKNLLSNAIKFTEQGTIDFYISRSENKADLFKTNLDPAQTIAIRISDTGIGIPEEKQGLIFEAFQQVDGSTSRKYGGTGLGLSISREMVKLLGGNMTLQSDQGEGSVFTLYLPYIHPTKLEKNNELPVTEILYNNFKDVSQSSIKVLSKAEKPIVEGKSTKEKIISENKNKIAKIELSENDRVLLIIEDDPGFAQIVQGLADDKGFKGIIASDGEMGLQMAKDYQPMAIILDIGLPKMDGWMVMEELKMSPDTRHIPVHFVSAMDKDIRAMKMGAIGFLTKPISQKDLENAFLKIETTIAKTVKHLLIVEDNQILRDSMVALMENMDAQISAVSTGQEAYQYLVSKSCDCLVLGLGLEDMSGLELLEKIKSHKALTGLPVIIYTGKELTIQEERQLKEYADSIIIKGVGSMERLLGEMTLFLHQVETELPVEQQRMLQKVYNKDQILKGKTILLVDDDARSSFALSNKLEAYNINVIRAFDGKEALESLNSELEVDLVLMDIMMPGMDGFETIQEIRKQKRFQNLSVIALTAKAMKEDREKCLKAGANDYLPKPVDTSKLLSLLRVWLFSK
jgi:CheY-like chemotaxis protein/CHASE3 domain sensor protein